MNLKIRLAKLESSRKNRQPRIIILLREAGQTEAEAKAALNKAKAEKGWQDIPDDEIKIIRITGIKSGEY